MTVDEIESYEGASGAYTSESISSNTSLTSILEQIEKNLPAFSDFISPTATDVKLNEELVTQEIVLYFQREQHIIKVSFLQENKELNKRSRVDIGVYPHERKALDLPYFVLEAKRLPAPSAPRKKEYVSLVEETKRKGGIERFKLGLHGEYLTHCGMIGYVEKETFEHWLKEVNTWIEEIVSAKSDPDVEWKIEEKLKLAIDKGKYAMLDSRCFRRHKGIDDEIKLSHFWVKII